MTVAAQPRNRYLDRSAPSSLADVIDAILNKGLSSICTFALPLSPPSC
jgi:hypothetical protein